jgi:hypothetical protein
MLHVKAHTIHCIIGDEAGPDAEVKAIDQKHQLDALIHSPSVCFIMSTPATFSVINSITPTLYVVSTSPTSFDVDSTLAFQGIF